MALRHRILRSRPIAFIRERILLSRNECGALGSAFFWSAVSGVLLALAFPPLEWCALAWVGLIPFLLHLQGSTPKEGAWLGWIFGVVFFYLNLLWLNTLRSVNPFAPAGVALLACVCALAPALFGALASLLLARSGWLRFLGIPALWTAIEFMRSWSELAFPWMFLGHTQVNRLPLIQICDLTGVAGLSFLIVIVNLAAADTYRAFFLRHTAPRSLIPKYGLIAATFAFVMIYGSLKLTEGKTGAPLKPDESREFRVSIIQPGVPQWRKLASYMTQDESSQRLLRSMIEEIADQIERVRLGLEESGQNLPDLYVLPESAVTYPAFNLSPPLMEATRDWARIGGAPVFFGANRFARPTSGGNGEMRVFNSAYLADADHGVDTTGAYDKMHLVPFGEYGSYFDIIPGFTDYILGIGSFEPGAGPRLFQVGNTRFGSLICFESCFPYLFRKYDALDVDWMAVLTNDAWYKTSSGVRRHQVQSIFRAIEMRRPIVRVANTGISCVIDAWGRVTAQLPQIEGRPAAHTATVPLRPATAKDIQTLYMQAGEWFAWLCLALSAVALLMRLRQLRLGLDEEGLAP